MKTVELCQIFQTDYLEMHLLGITLLLKNK